MSDEDRTRVAMPQAQMWTLSQDRRMVHMSLPPISVSGLSKPLDLHLAFDTATVDLMLSRLTELRVQMLPPPERH